MALTVSACDYLRQVLREVCDDFCLEVAWCRHVGVDYASLFGREVCRAVSA